MSRTYIGPFGRILPILDGHEPEHPQLPVDETRTNMTTYQLPPPEKLQFGSDTSPGFTEPMRYNTISQSRRPAEVSNPMYSEQPRQLPDGQLPPVRQLFLPLSSNVQAFQYPPQHNANPSLRRSNIPPVPRSVFEQSPLVPQNLHQSCFPQSALPSHVQTSTNTNVQGDKGNSSSDWQPSLSHSNPNHGPSATSYPASYPTFSERPPPVLYSAASAAKHIQQPPLPRTPQSHRSPPLDAHQPQRGMPMNTPVLYYQDHSGNYAISSTSAPVRRQSPQAVENTVKPMARVVGDADVPGQGPSWVYEDGTTCKKIIDGEEVNARWGVTKAGKPRKRLAIACTTCREKKIKCDPAEPKCVQCEKFGRECRFTTAQRTSPETPSYHSQACTPPIYIKIESCTQPSLLSDSSPVSTEGQTLLRRRNSSPQINQIKPSGTDCTKLYGHKPPLKSHQSNLLVQFSPKAERKQLPVKNCAQEAGFPSTEAIHKRIESRIPSDPFALHLSAKAELKIVDELKTWRDRLLRAIERKCEYDCQEGMKPCSILL